MGHDIWAIIEPGEPIEGYVVVPASANWPLEVEIRCRQRGGFGLEPISANVEWRRRPLRWRARAWGKISGRYRVVFEGMPKEDVYAASAELASPELDHLPQASESAALEI